MSKSVKKSQLSSSHLLYELQYVNSNLDHLEPCSTTPLCLLYELQYIKNLNFLFLYLGSIQPL